MHNYLWDIPNECQKKLEDNFEIKKCIRLVKSEIVTINDFLPSVIENPNRFIKWSTHVNLNCKPYSVSLFNTVETALNMKVLIKKYNFLAVGNTDIKKGVAMITKKTGHIDYYLFDYLGNSPYVDYKKTISRGDCDE